MALAVDYWDFLTPRTRAALPGVRPAPQNDIVHANPTVDLNANVPDGNLDLQAWIPTEYPSAFTAQQHYLNRAVILPGPQYIGQRILHRGGQGTTSLYQAQNPAGGFNVCGLGTCGLSPNIAELCSRISSSKTPMSIQRNGGTKDIGSTKFLSKRPFTRC
jgi:hypothetical protein